MNKPRRLSLDEAARLAIEEIGGLQEVGHKFWNHMNPVLAGQRLSHALTSDRDGDKLKGGQYDWIFDEAEKLGFDAPIEGWARGRGVGYVVKRIDPDRLMTDSAARLVAIERETAEVKQDIEAARQAKLRAQMERSGVNTEGMA